MKGITKRLRRSDGWWHGGGVYICKAHLRRLRSDMNLRVYISGPITKGDRNRNYFQAIEAERELMRHGIAPLNPMQTMVLPFAWDGEFSHAQWLERDFAWIIVSDAILRLPGESIGADAECEFATECGIPVFDDIQKLIAKVKREASDAT